jgi:nucleotide-binding universal stress UspA family protein
MTTPNIQVVVGFDFGLGGRVALSRAIGVAARAPFHVLHVVCVIEPHTPIPGIPAERGVDYPYAETVQHAVTAVVHEEIDSRDIAGPIHFFVHARIGKPATEILDVAREVGAELIIVGSRGTIGLERLLVGSVAGRVVREAGCTVEVARPQTYPHVELMDVFDVEAHPGYVPPHRYSYENRNLSVRPTDWPLY